MQYIAAKHHGAVRGAPTLIVLHDMEAPEAGGTAESVARYFANGSKIASAHYCTDNNSSVQCVQDDVVAYAAPGANRVGLHFELAGYARQTPEEWMDAYGRGMFGQVIPLVAAKCKQYNIPPVFLRAEELKAGNMNGVTTHAEVTKAFHLTTHTDPGAGFPIGFFIFVLAATMNGQPTPPNAPPPAPAPQPPATTSMEEVLKALAFLIFVMKVEVSQGKFYKEGDGKANGRDKGVRMIQAAMQKAGQWIAVDGEFGPATKAHVVYYQAHHSLLADGIVGSATLNAMFP